MTEKKTTKKEIEEELNTVIEELKATKQQLLAVSEGYQNLLNAINLLADNEFKNDFDECIKNDFFVVDGTCKRILNSIL